MPELCRTGLSESWLLKACGHRHWMALAEAHGLAEPDFRDEHGQRLYPAFTHISVQDAYLDMVEEGSELALACTLERSGRAGFEVSLR